MARELTAPGEKNDMPEGEGYIIDIFYGRTVSSDVPGKLQQTKSSPQEGEGIARTGSSAGYGQRGKSGSRLLVACQPKMRCVERTIRMGTEGLQRAA